MESNTEKEVIECLLCSSESHEFFFRDKFREYKHCSQCSLLFVPPQFHLSSEKEKARYDEHNNDPDDIRYRQFLERIVPPIQERFETGARGLDFGCGPTPLLAKLLGEVGFEMEVYDLFYATDKSVLDNKFDFIVSTEVIEHLSKPLDVIQKLLSMLEPDGALAVMTRLYDDSVNFRGWHYKNDQTHIGFYSLDTFDWLVQHLGIRYAQVESDIFLFEPTGKSRAG